ncbi:MAG: MarR family transcriptional regulator [Anaerolineaceae bacterium]|nr:MarR family transcriptional regulator [Anaerolineaceae bacterium]
MVSSEPLIATTRKWIEVFMRRSMRDFLLYAKESGLSMSQIGAMFHIARHGALSVSDISEELGVTSAAASQMVDRLVHQGLITRSENPQDRRAKQIVVTEKGRRVLQDSLHARQRWLDELAALLSPAEQEQVVAALQILIEKTNQLEQQPELQS